MKKVKLGIIGTGLAAKNLHIPVLKKLKEKFEIVAVANRSEKKGREFSKLIGDVPYYSDYTQLLKNDDIEAVDIAVPIDLNYKIAKDSLKAGKNIFLEKPLASNLKEATNLISLSNNSKQVAMVAENFVYRKVFKQAKKYIDTGKIGSPYAVNWNLYYDVGPDKDYGATLWRQKHNYLGGFMLDAGVHNIAAIRLMLGDFKSGNAITTSINPNIGKIDTMSFQFELKSGVFGNYNLFFSVNAYWEDKLLILGSKGSIEIQTNILTLKRKGKEEIIKEYSNDNGFYEEFDNFYKAIINRSKVEYSFNDAKRDLEITLGAIKSATTKRRIFFT